MFKRVPLSMLADGLVLGSAVLADDQRVLLTAGVPMTQDLILSLYKRDIQSVVVSEDDWERINAFSACGKSRHALPSHANTKCDLAHPSTEQLDDELKRHTPSGITPSENPFSAKVQKKGAVAYEQRDMDAMVDLHRRTAGQMQELLGQLSEGQAVSAEAVRKLSEESLAKAAQDLDLFVCMGINPGEQNSIYKHSANVATLAVAIGATLGLDEQALCDLGVGCLVHDAGMLKIDRRLYESNQVIQDLDFVEIAKHPVISTDMLYHNMKAVPLAVRMITYQMHERCNGSGYPRGTTCEKIHPLAKVASVADAYVALVSPRPHRPAMLPYHAMARILNDVKEGLFDAGTVRGLLQTISLFPIGSYVELNNGLVGKTIRANGPQYDKPVVQAWKRTNLTATPQVINLAAEDDTKVVKPLTSLR